MPTLLDAFTEACARNSARPAVADDEAVLSYGELADRARRTGAVLREAVPPGTDRIGFLAGNATDVVAAYYGAIGSGLVPVILDPALTRRDIASVVASCGLRAFLCDDTTSATVPDRIEVARLGRLRVLLGPSAAAIPALDPRTGTCRFTSGTTGAPKCLEFSHEAVESAARNWASGTGLGADDRVLCLATLANGLAFNTSLLAVFVAGAQLRLYGGMLRSSRIQSVLREGAITRLVGFPLAYRILADAPDLAPRDLATLRLAISAGAPLPAEVRARFTARTGVAVADYYGIAEVGPCTFERDLSVTRGLGTALPGVELRAPSGGAEPGEVAVRTASMATRYLNHPGALAARLDADGFYRTGDLGYIEHGRLHVTGRLGGPINLAGRKIDPVEIETFVRGLERVTDASAFADRDAAGETFIHLAVAGSEGLTGRAVREACLRELASFKVPSRISVVPAIPRSSSGKVRRGLLQDLISADTPRTIPLKS